MCCPCNLCCGLSLQKGCKAVGIFEIIASLFIAKFGAVKVWNLYQDPNGDDPRYLIKLIIWSSLLFGSLLTAIMGCVLFHAAKKGNSLRIKVWLVIHGVLFVLEILTMYFYKSLTTNVLESPEMKAKSVSGSIVSLYCLAVVYTFYKQLKEQPTHETHGLQVTTFTAV